MIGTLSSMIITEEGMETQRWCNNREQLISSCVHDGRNDQSVAHVFISHMAEGRVGRTQVDGERMRGNRRNGKERYREWGGRGMRKVIRRSSRNTYRILEHMVVSLGDIERFGGGMTDVPLEHWTGTFVSTQQFG